MKVRDELAMIVNNGLPPEGYGASAKVDRILDRLMEASFLAEHQESRRGVLDTFIQDVKNGAL